MNASELRQACIDAYKSVAYEYADYEAVDAVIRTVLEHLISEYTQGCHDDPGKPLCAMCQVDIDNFTALLPSTDRTDNG